MLAQLWGHDDRIDGRPDVRYSFQPHDDAKITGKYHAAI
jgi:hypothetical protein